MTSQRKKIVLLGAIAAGAALLVGGAWALHVGPFGAAGRGSVLATVDGDPIYLSDARYRAMGLAAVHGGPTGSLDEGWQERVLQSLVDDLVIQAEAERRGLIASDQEVAAQILDLRELFPSLAEYEAWLGSQQMDEDELERRVRLQTTAVRVYEAVTADVEVSEGEIRNYYEEHPQEFLGADGSPVPFSAVRDSIAESLMEEEKNGAYAAWLDARRRAATLVIVMDDWWRSMQDEQQS